MTGKPLPPGCGPGPNAGPAVQKLYELLLDGEWHPWHEIIDEVAKVVTPGRATRAAEQIRARTGPAERRKPRTHDELVLFGQRDYARRASRHKWFEVDPPGRTPPGVTKRIRLRPIEEPKE